MALISKVSILSGAVFTGVPRMIGLYPQFTYETASIYVWTIGTLIASIVGAIRLKKKMELLWGGWLVGWGLIMALYTSYNGVLLAIVKIGLLAGYCLRVIYLLERHQTQIDAGSPTFVRRHDLEEEKGSSKYTRYSQLFATSLLITIPTWLVSMFYFAVFYEAIPKAQRGEALLCGIKMGVVVVAFYFGYIIYTNIFKKVHDFMIWIAVAVAMSLGIIPAIFGFGWIYAVLVGIPWGITTFFCGKMEKERWKARRGDKCLSLNHDR